MKKLLTIACTLVLGSIMSLAQAGTAQNPPASGDTGKTSTSTTTKGKKHHHKGGKKGKKSSGDTTTTPPK
ncbi:MAG: hypothetical protein WA738_17760 [Candidatus Angelobacter sp.]